MTDHLPLLEAMLSAIFHRSIIEPDADAGIAHLASVAAQSVPADAWRAVVAEAAAAGLIYDPVRLPAGALQCHWHLALTPNGVKAAQRSRSFKGEIS